LESEKSLERNLQFRVIATMESSTFTSSVWTSLPGLQQNFFFPKIPLFEIEIFGPRLHPTLIKNSKIHFTVATNMTSDTNCNIAKNKQKRNRCGTNLLHAVVPFLDTKGSVQNSADIPAKYCVNNQCSSRISIINDHTTCNTQNELGQTKVPLI